jgi:uncharacterized cupredoxin-like copper-binding protein
MAEMIEKDGMEGMSHSDPNAVLVKARETKELTWKFGAATQLEYDCKVPGHYEAGMTGGLLVN